MNRHDQQQILRILRETYVNDMYVPQKRTAFSPEFHPAFQILVSELDGRTGKITDVHWLRPDLSHAPDPKAIRTETTFEIAVLDITGKAGVGKVETSMGGHLKYTDYVLFTKGGGGWKVVGKIFHQHLPGADATG